MSVENEAKESIAGLMSYAKAQARVKVTITQLVACMNNASVTELEILRAQLEDQFDDLLEATDEMRKALLWAVDEMISQGENDAEAKARN